MNLSTILLIVLILIVAGALPTWPRSWSYGPSGIPGAGDHPDRSGVDGARSGLSLTD